MQEPAKLSRLAFLKQLSHPVWRWVVIAIFGIMGGVGGLRDEILPPEVSERFRLLQLLPTFPWEWWAIGGLLIALSMFFESCFRMVRPMQQRLSELEIAWDRTDAFLVPISEAVPKVLDTMDFSFGIPESDRMKKVATRFREIGMENQAMLWGREYDEEEKIFAEPREQISPVFWKKNLIDMEAVMSGDLSRAQTTEDPIYSHETQAQPMYGHLQISRRTLLAMFPKRKK